MVRDHFGQIKADREYQTYLATYCYPQQITEQYYGPSFANLLESMQSNTDIKQFN